MSFDSAFEAGVDLPFSIALARGAVGYHGFVVVILADRDQWLAVLASIHENLLGPDSEVIDCWFLQLVELFFFVVRGPTADGEMSAKERSA